MRERFGRGTQGRAKVPFATFVWSMAVHALSPRGSLGHHVRLMSGAPVSDAAAHGRRQGLGWDWFAALFASVPKPLAVRGQHGEAFCQGLRLLGVDGTWWSLRNAPAIAALPRALARAGEEKSPAFFKWGAAVLLELGTHQPLMAACAELEKDRGEGEITIARRVLAGIPQGEDTLLLADANYGRGAFLADVRDAAGPRCQMLFRVPSGPKPKVLEVLADGSALIEVRVCHRGGQRLRTTLLLREIRGRVRREGGEEENEGKGTGVRLWTTLLDEKKHPAKELLALYARRWEQELFFRELKRHTAREQLLRAGSPRGAEAELGAMIIAASLLAAQRLEAADLAGLPPSRLSLVKVGRGLEAFLQVLSVTGSLLTGRQRDRMTRKFLEHLAREARIPPRRSRGCQRGLRKPACAWPRVRTRQYLDGAWVYEIINVPFP